jgi:hypothetical protein
MKRVKMRSDDKWWITPHIKVLMDEKDRAYKRGNPGLVIAIQKRLLVAISQAKRKRTISKMFGSSMKDKWRYVKRCLNSKRICSTKFSEPEAHSLNKKFCSVFNPEDLNQFDFEDFSKHCSYSPPEIETYQVADHLERIKSFAIGPDGISGVIFKQHAVFLAEPLCILFNKSISQHKIPSLWKCATVIPLPKSKDEYRPISLLCHPMKILEKIVLQKWLYPSLKKPFATNQFAFVPNAKYSGCANALTLGRIWTV